MGSSAPAAAPAALPPLLTWCGLGTAQSETGLPRLNGDVRRQQRLKTTVAAARGDGLTNYGAVGRGTARLGGRASDWAGVARRPAVVSVSVDAIRRRAAGDIWPTGLC